MISSSHRKRSLSLTDAFPWQCGAQEPVVSRPDDVPKILGVFSLSEDPRKKQGGQFFTHAYSRRPDPESAKEFNSDR
ncbi:hypothetical protein V5799_026010 [Amblyomma americanum]|uniref:Uncharacterized protein n=1 Tax=Amblyomma americanum TaxID=6943 RepID=A0AAQ4DJT3_AMBAM